MKEFFSGLKGGKPARHDRHRGRVPTFADSDSPPSSSSDSSSDSSDSSSNPDRTSRSSGQTERTAAVFAEIYSDFKFPSATSPNEIPIKPASTVVSSLTLGFLAASGEKDKKRSSHYTPSTFSEVFYSSDGMHCLSSYPRDPRPRRIPKGIDAGTVLKTLILHPPRQFIPMNFIPYEPTLKACALRLTQIHATIPFLHTPLKPKPVNDTVCPPILASVYEIALADDESNSAAQYNRAVGAMDMLAGDDHFGVLTYLTDIAVTSMNRCRNVRCKRIAIVSNLPAINRLILNDEEDEFINGDLLRVINANLKSHDDFGLYQNKAKDSSSSFASFPSSSLAALPSPTSPVLPSPFPSSFPSPSTTAPSFPAAPPGSTQGNLSSEINRSLEQRRFRKRGGKDGRGGGKGSEKTKGDTGPKQWKQPFYKQNGDAQKKPNSTKNGNALLATPQGGAD